MYITLSFIIQSLLLSFLPVGLGGALVKNYVAEPYLSADSAAVKTSNSLQLALTFFSNKEEIDMLDYMLKSENNSNIGLANADKSFFWHQVVTADNRFYLQKWNDPEQVIHYSYDEKNIYMVTDSTGAHPYKFNPGVWAKRKMKVGERVEMKDNTAEEMTLDCRKTNSQRSWPYSVTFEYHFPKFNLGGDLGVQDVIVLKYEWGEGFRGVEREYYAKGHGIVRWEYYDNGVLDTSVSTNKLYRYNFNTPSPLCYDLKGNWKPKQYKTYSEPADIGSFVRHLYSCVLKNDAPDAAGVSYWSGKIEADELSVSNAFRYFYGYQNTFSDSYFVESLYKCILFREPEPEGYNYWLESLKVDSKANQIEYFLNLPTFKLEILPRLEKAVKSI